MSCGTHSWSIWISLTGRGYVKIQVCLELEFINILPDAFEELAAVEAGEAGPPGGDVHPGHVVHRTEHADLVVDAAVRLHALEQLLHNTMSGYRD